MKFALSEMTQEIDSDSDKHSIISLSSDDTKKKSSKPPHWQTIPSKMRMDDDEYKLKAPKREREPTRIQDPASRNPKKV